MVYLLIILPAICGIFLFCLSGTKISEKIPRPMGFVIWMIWAAMSLVCAGIFGNEKQTESMAPYIQMSENPKGWLEEKVRRIPNIGKGGTLALVEREIGSITEAIHDTNHCRCRSDEEVMILGNARESLRKLHSELEQIGE